MIDLDLRLPDLEDAFEEAFGRSIGLDELVVIDEFAAMVVEAIQAVWPVKTGLSSDAWEAEALEPPAIGIRLFNGVEYAPYVHLSGEPATPPLWEQVIDEIRARIGRPLGQALWSVAEDASRGRMPASVASQRRPLPPSTEAVLTVFEAG